MREKFKYLYIKYLAFTALFKKEKNGKEKEITKCLSKTKKENDIEKEKFYQKI